VTHYENPASVSFRIDGDVSILLETRDFSLHLFHYGFGIRWVSYAVYPWNLFFSDASDRAMHTYVQRWRVILCMAYVVIKLELHNANLPKNEANYGVVR